MGLISHASEINTLAKAVPDSGGVYFVTAFSGLLAPHWDPSAAGLLIGLLSYMCRPCPDGLTKTNAGISQYTNPGHLARAVLEANAFQTRAILEGMKLDSGTDLKCLKVDGGMTNGDFAMTVLADIGGFSVIRPEMREYVIPTNLIIRLTRNKT
jgi:glycerol kinase